MFDILITGGTIYDGTGVPGRRADLGINGEQITAVDDLSTATAARMIDATGWAVAPGFIDTHTHSEGDLLVNPQHACGLRQGITTEVMGLDGMSFAPLSPANHILYRRWLAGLLGEPIEGLQMDSVTSFRSNYHRKVAINTAYLIPHSAIRLETVGFLDVPMQEDDMAKAKRIIAQGLEEGAVGFSTGGSYYPSPWGTTDEFAELCHTVAAADRIYLVEPRRAELDRAHLGDGVEEGLQVGRQTGVKVHFAHFRTSPANAGQVDELMAAIDAAEAEGIDISLDVYPYPTGSSIPVSILPGWAQEGGPDAILERLGDESERGKIAAFLENMDLGDRVFTYLEGLSELEGMS